jgi:hypothetical protein
MRQLSRLRRSSLIACSLALCLQARAQDPLQQEGTRRDEPLRFRLGRIEFAPYIRVGEVALDSNVHYTPEDRKTDLTTNGGPGLRITIPAGRFRFYGDGNVDYYWFLRTKEERHLGGEAGGGTAWDTTRFAAGASRFFSRTYRRPSIEVDQRVEQDGWRDDAYLSLDLGRVTALPSYTSLETETGSVAYLGVDLGRTLTQNRRNVALETLWHLTPKTDFVVMGDQEWTRFPRQGLRDSDSNRIAGGFQLTSATRLRGRLVGGVRLFRAVHTSEAQATKPYADAHVDWILGA